MVVHRTSECSLTDTTDTVCVTLRKAVSNFVSRRRAGNDTQEYQPGLHTVSDESVNEFVRAQQQRSVACNAAHRRDYALAVAAPIRVQVVAEHTRYHEIAERRRANPERRFDLQLLRTHAKIVKGDGKTYTLDLAFHIDVSLEPNAAHTVSSCVTK